MEHVHSNGDEFITRKELAHRLGIKNLKTLDRMRKDGRLPVGIYLSTRAIRFHWPSIVAALAAVQDRPGDPRHAA